MQKKQIMITPELFAALVKGNRSFRRFDQTVKISKDTLTNLVNLARHTASAANLQPLKYIISTDQQKNAQIFSCLKWAGYLKDWKGPVKTERPTGYIVILGDTTITKNISCDHGIAAQTILLGARPMGLGGCIFGITNNKELRKHLEIPEPFEIKLVIALGRPIEKVHIDNIDTDGSIKYWRDDNQVHHVPKRKLSELIVRKW